MSSTGLKSLCISSKRSINDISEPSSTLCPWKKLFQAIPVAGMFFGAYTNRKALEEVAEAARMLYRKRRILERLAQGGKSAE
ncbi:MAG TPA: hypothetical protein DEA91_14890 [Paenibacillus sp.]|nr:hypothetical protein [Paenibacillus sp.]